MDQVGECKLPHPHPHSTAPQNYREFIRLPTKLELISSLDTVFLLGAFGVVHHLDLWNIRHIAIRSLMGAWLFKTPIGPQDHYLNPLKFYTIKKEKVKLGSVVQEAKPCGTGNLLQQVQ